jgi:hypothetical protein
VGQLKAGGRSLKPETKSPLLAQRTREKWGTRPTLEAWKPKPAFGIWYSSHRINMGLRFI